MERDEGPPTRLRERVEGEALPVVLAIAFLSLFVRLDGLGTRVAHWDEGRVAFDTLRYMETGIWEYRPIVHGPFLPHVNELLFSVVGPTDFTMRLVVALVGASLPLAPWLFREHLRPLEVIAASLLLAFSPVLVYYSRFMRNDVLVATFMLLALGMFVRLYDTRRVRFLYAGAAFAALGFTTKENAIVYVLCWIGAGALVLDTALYRAYAAESTRTVLARRKRAVLERARAVDLRDRILFYGGHLALACVLGALIIVYFYAPRTGGTGIGFERLANRPDLFPAVADRAFADLWDGISNWSEKGADAGDESLLDRMVEYGGAMVAALLRYSPGFVVLAIAGVVGERYLAAEPRSIVMFFAYWGVVSLPGYALGMDILAMWSLVHVLVPLAFPAAVALGYVLGWGLDAADEVRRPRPARSGDAVLSVSVAAVLVVSMLAVTAGTAYDPSNTRESGEDSHLVQYAQPGQDVRETLEDVEAVIAESDDPVLYYADEYAIDNESAAYRPPVSSKWTEDADGNSRQVEDNGNWYRRLPLPWYMERAGAERTSAHTREELERVIAEENPVVIVTMREYRGTSNEEVVDYYADEYVKVTHEMRSPGTETVFYIRKDALESLEGG